MDLVAVESGAVVVAAESVLVVVGSVVVVVAEPVLVVVESVVVAVESVVPLKEPVAVVVVWAAMADQSEVLLTPAVEEEVGGWEPVVMVVVLALVSPAGQRWRAHIVGPPTVGRMTVGRSVTRARAIQSRVYLISLPVAMFSIVILAGTPQLVSRRLVEVRPGQSLSVLIDRPRPCLWEPEFLHLGAPAAARRRWD
jgi:hypothetical protein